MYGQVSPLSPLVCFLTRTQQLEKILRFREATLSQIILEKLVNKSVNTVKVEREFLSHNSVLSSLNVRSLKYVTSKSNSLNLMYKLSLSFDVPACGFKSRFGLKFS